MCGIVGCLALALEADPDQNWVHTATERITHRGPDDEGFYTDPDVALGFRRLAIIDLSPGGHQPMRSADGRYWMVYNGEIYNYVELGQELRAAGRDAAYHLATPRSCWRCTRWWARTWCTGCAACSRSRSGTPGPGSCSAPGTSSGSSRSTTRVDEAQEHDWLDGRPNGPGCRRRQARAGTPHGIPAPPGGTRPGRPARGPHAGARCRAGRPRRPASSGRHGRHAVGPDRPATSQPSAQPASPRISAARPGRPRPAAAVRLRAQVPWPTRAS